jgi:hypothetical protein
MFTLHAIQAEFGDSLLLEFGTAGAPKFILVDGGPPTTYERHLQLVLDQRVAATTQRLERVILSHIDTDHVTGLIDLFAKLREQRANGEPESVAIAGLWHNSFERTIDQNSRLVPRLRSLLSTAGAQNIMSGTAIVVNGISEGNGLRIAAQDLNIPINAGFADVITLDTAGSPVEFDNLRLTVVGPTRANLDALQHEWEMWLDQHEDQIATGDPLLMANSDRSVPNLSSISLLAEADGRRLLLTGDARSDHLLQGLQAAGLIDDQGGMQIDVLKMPHHGSDRNITKTFFRKVRADRYVISANGKYGNPDLATLIWLVEAAKEQDRQIEIIITNETDSTAKLREEYPTGEYGYELRVRADGESSVTVVLQDN